VSPKPGPQLARTGCVPPGPFLDFIRQTFPTFDVAARRLGIGDGHLRAIRRGEHTVIHLSMVDRALVRYGHPEFLNQLYPACRYCGRVQESHDDRHPFTPL